MAIKGKFKSDLAIAKGLGSSGSGSEHWLRQRVTAFMLVLFGIWLAYFFLQISGKEVDGMALILKRPYNVVMVSLFVLIGFYHAVLGLQVIIEDYVTCRFSKIAFLLLVQIFSIVTVAAFLVAILYIMVL